MADNSNYILNQLQQHTVQPPADAFEKAWQAIVQDEGNAGGNELAADRKIFAQLQEHELAAPAFDFNTIIDKPAKKTFHIPAYWLRAASVLLILASGGILYFTVFYKKGTPVTNYTTQGVTKDSSAVIAANKINDPANKVSDTAANNNAVAAGSSSIKPKKKIFIAGKAASSQKRSENKLNSSEGQLFENDMMLTLVNYKSRDWQRFFTKAVTEKKITLSKYSYHNLSDKMVEMLQDMYLVKGNGKPSRKAKKTKRKFEKWRKKDEKYFDKELQKNPTDIIDLSDFILKK